MKRVVFRCRTVFIDWVLEPYKPEAARRKERSYLQVDRAEKKRCLTAWYFYDRSRTGRKGPVYRWYGGSLLLMLFVSLLIRWLHRQSIQWHHLNFTIIAHPANGTVSS